MLIFRGVSLKFIVETAFILFPLCLAADVMPESQVRVNGRVATFSSVVKYCGGDSVKAAEISNPLPVDSPYLSAERVNAERFYNAFNPAWLCVGVALCGIAFSSSALVALLLVVVVAGDFALRWWLGGSVPLVGVVDMGGAIALLLSVIALCVASSRRWLYVVIVLLMLCLIFRGSHPAVRPLNPSLQSLWLPIHVSLMVVAYTSLMLSAISAIVFPNKNIMRRCIVVGELFLAAGIGIGSLWAADAWGRYWAWDPKETSALVTLLIYIGVLIMWSRLQGNPLAMRIVVAISFLAVVFTWIGVSGGLHAY